MLSHLVLVKKTSEEISKAVHSTVRTLSIHVNIHLLVLREMVMRLKALYQLLSQLR
jgi:hypothetical protein